jgi:hypothetical protein
MPTSGSPPNQVTAKLLMRGSCRSSTSRIRPWTRSSMIDGNLASKQYGQSKLQPRLVTRVSPKWLMSCLLIA